LVITAGAFTLLILAAGAFIAIRTVVLLVGEWRKARDD